MSFWLELKKVLLNKYEDYDDAMRIYSQIINVRLVKVRCKECGKEGYITRGRIANVYFFCPNCKRFEEVKPRQNEVRVVMARCSQCRCFAYGTYTGNPSCILKGGFSELRPDGSGFVDGRRRMCKYGELDKFWREELGEK